MRKEEWRMENGGNGKGDEEKKGIGMVWQRRNLIWLAVAVVGAIAAALNARVAVADEPGKLTEEQRKELKAESDRNWGEAGKFAEEGKLKEALAAGERASVVNRRLFGEVHPEVVGDHNWLAGLYQRIDDLAAARHHRGEAFRLETLLHDPGHWHITDARIALSDVEQLQKLKPADRAHLREADDLFQQAVRLSRQNSFAQSIQPAEKALEIRSSILGESHHSLAEVASWLADGQHEVGEYEKAEQHYRQALDINRKSRGESHPGYARAIGDLAILYRSSGDYARAEPLFRQALEATKRAVGEQSADYANALSNLAMLYNTLGDVIKAEPLLRQALEITKSVLGEAHLDYATRLDNLAEAYFGIGDLPRAEPLRLQASEIRRKGLGEDHPLYAVSLNNLGRFYEATGNYSQAEKYYGQAKEIRKKTLGEFHRAYGASLSDLARLYEAMGQDARAEPLYLEALKISRRNLELAANGQSERQQLAMLSNLRYQLDSLLGVAAKVKSGAKIYDEALAWKGLVLGRQQQLRAALAANPQLAPLWGEIRQVTAKLASLSLAMPPAGQAAAWQTQVNELSRQKESLEARLIAGSKDLRETVKPMRVADVQAALPPNAVIVDFFEYFYTDRKPNKERGGLLWETRTGPTLKQSQHGLLLGGGLKKWERRLVAFVVRAKGEVELVDMGNVQPIDAAIQGWRKDQGLSPATKEAAQQLRERVWLPAEKHFQGVTSVFISPDGELCKLPFAAIGGQSPGTYLLEDFALAVLPAPQLLVSAMRTAHAPAERESMLVLANVDYNRQGASPGTQSASKPTNQVAARAARDDATAAFEPLDGTRGELDAIQKFYDASFGSDGLTTLASVAATEDAFLREAPRHHYLHVATHGYFAAERFKSALARTTEESRDPEDRLISNQSLAGYHPGLLSGLAMAGANRPTSEEDGILTAAEVATLNLREVDLVVLSACETGLGKTAGGEGLLGLQRAFQVAGAKTVVASLWSVPDQATKTLMVRFYENLWKKKMSKMEALREAQLWMLQRGAEQQEIRREAAARGLKEFAEDGGQRTGNGGRLPPYFWAAWVLSGEWK